MPPSLLTRLRRSKDALSAGRALALLFFLAGILGSFASGAFASPPEDGAVYRVTVATPGDAGGEPALFCCTLACPMAMIAVPVHPAAGLVLPSEASGLVAAATLVSYAQPAILGSNGSPRGPPTTL